MGIEDRQRIVDFVLARIIQARQWKPRGFDMDIVKEVTGELLRNEPG